MCQKESSHFKKLAYVKGYKYFCVSICHKNTIQGVGGRSVILQKIKVMLAAFSKFFYNVFIRLPLPFAIVV